MLIARVRQSRTEERRTEGDCQALSLVPCKPKRASTALLVRQTSFSVRGDRGARSVADAVTWLTIPLISNDAVDLGKKRLLEHELGELFHERPQSSLLHGWNELVVQATLSEQGMCPSLSGAGFEMLI